MGQLRPITKFPWIGVILELDQSWQNKSFRKLLFGAILLPIVISCQDFLSFYTLIYSNSAALKLNRLFDYATPMLILDLQV